MFEHKTKLVFFMHRTSKSNWNSMWDGIFFNMPNIYIYNISVSKSLRALRVYCFQLKWGLLNFYCVSWPTEPGSFINLSFFSCCSQKYMTHTHNGFFRGQQVYFLEIETDSLKVTDFLHFCSFTLICSCYILLDFLKKIFKKHFVKCFITL